MNRVGRIFAPNVLVGVLLSALLSANQAYADSVERRIDADPRGEVEVVNVAGEIRVTGWDRAEVQVKAELSSNVERMDVVRDGDHVLVKVVLKSGNHRSGENDLDIRVPQGSRLTTSTVSADQHIADVHGAQRLQSVSGSIDTDVWEGGFDAKSVSGSVHAKGRAAKDKSAPGLVRVTTVSGEVEIEDIGSELELRSVSGELEVRGRDLTRANISTTNGDLRLVASIAPGAKIDAETINGELRFDFIGTVNADFDIETFNGEIDNCFGPKPKRTSEYAPGTQLRFKEGTGEARVRIKTLNGGVRVCRR
jgi:DUF4097 and DUF4098 domain-containing protein YvlB